MEVFFLQKRFLISALKPEMLLKDENQELRHEISRKDNLINKHYNRLEEWKALLSDQQQQQVGNKKVKNIKNILNSIFLFLFSKSYRATVNLFKHKVI